MSTKVLHLKKGRAKDGVTTMACGLTSPSRRDRPLRYTTKAPDVTCDRCNVTLEMDRAMAKVMAERKAARR